MIRKAGRRMLVLTSVMLAVGVATSSASAKSIHLPVVHQVAQASVPKPNGIAYDGYNDEIFVTSVGPPPRVYAYDGLTHFEKGFIDLPSDAEPGAIEFAPDGYLYVVDHAQKRIFRVCPECGEVVPTTIPALVDFITGYIDGYQTGPMLLDFGDSFSAGSLWYGGGFQTRMILPDTITPNGGDILPDVAKTRKGRIADELLLADADHNDLIRVSDAPTPGVLGTIGGLPGNPGLQPPRDVDVNPLNLNPDVTRAAIHPVFVVFPDLGLYESAGPNGPWMQVPTANIGRPTQISSDCGTVGATSFSQNTVSFFKLDEPKGSHCEDLVELVLYGGTSSADIVAGLKAFVDGKAAVSVVGGAPGEHGKAYEAKKGKKLKLTAGRVSKFKFRLPASVLARLRAHRKVVFRVKIRITSPTGSHATVVRRIRARR